MEKEKHEGKHLTRLEIWENWIFNNLVILLIGFSK